MFARPPAVKAPLAGAAPRTSVIANTAAKRPKYEARKKKHFRIRKKLSGDEERPRLCVFRSNENMYAQVIDDEKGNTMASANTLQKAVKERLQEQNVSASTADAATILGQVLAERCKESNIEKVCFDRAGYAYHGRVMALATAAREGGLNF